MARPIRYEGGIAYIPLTKGYEAIADAADAALLGASNWHAVVGTHTVYACRWRWLDGNRSAQLLHRVILDAAPGLVVDHVNGNGLDNRRANIRLCTRAQNLRNQGLSRANSSGFKGVTWDARKKKWRSQISLDGKNKYLGLFSTPESAHAAYECAAAEMHGEYRRVS